MDPGSIEEVLSTNNRTFMVLHKCFATPIASWHEKETPQTMPRALYCHHTDKGATGDLWTDHPPEQWKHEGMVPPRGYQEEQQQTEFLTLMV